LREKAVEIANELLLHGADEGIAIATGLKRARLVLKKEKAVSGKLDAIKKSKSNGAEK
jgi:uncharacterized protein YdaT